VVRPLPGARNVVTAAASDTPCVLRAVAVFLGAFVLVFAVLLAAVGQLGKIDRPTLAVALAAAAVAAAVAALRARRREP